MKVSVLTIHHKHGTNVSVHTSPEAAMEVVRAYVAEWWNQESVRVDDKLVDYAAFCARPESSPTTIEAYFEHMSGREDYEIEETTFGETVHATDPATVEMVPEDNGGITVVLKVPGYEGLAEFRMSAQRDKPDGDWRVFIPWDVDSDDMIHVIEGNFDCRGGVVYIGAPEDEG